MGPKKKLDGGVSRQSSYRRALSSGDVVIKGPQHIYKPPQRITSVSEQPAPTTSTAQSADNTAITGQTTPTQQQEPAAVGTEDIPAIRVYDDVPPAVGTEDIPAIRVYDDVPPAAETDEGPLTNSQSDSCESSGDINDNFNPAYFAKPSQDSLDSGEYDTPTDGPLRLACYNELDSSFGGSGIHLSLSKTNSLGQPVTPEQEDLIEELSMKLGTSVPQRSPSSPRSPRSQLSHGSPGVSTKISPQLQYNQKQSTQVMKQADRGNSTFYDDVPEETILEQSNISGELDYDDVPTAEEATTYHVLEMSDDETTPNSDRDTLRAGDTSTLRSEGIYEPVAVNDSEQYFSDVYDEWSSSEFEPIEERSVVDSAGVIGDVVGGLKTLFKSSIRGGKTKSQIYASLSFNFDRSRHPPPVLPDWPEGLNANQEKRRHVVSSMIEIENSYVTSLITLIDAYRKPLLENGLLPVDKVKTIFYKLEEILEGHLVFQIALHDRIKTWDTHEEIGGIFLENFSKELVLENYSEFVNNFMAATELFKRILKEKAAFAEFMKTQMKSVSDNLGPHGLMIKVVQRFPQYIMQFKDLIKHTSPEHQDYLQLHMALSKLENVAYQLNEKKRSSEEKLAASVILAKLRIKNPASVLLRQDDVSEVTYGIRGDVVEQKDRRLLLFNDLICLIKIDRTATGTADEKITQKWKCPIADVEYHESGGAEYTKSLTRAGTGTVIETAGRLGSHSDSRTSIESSTAAVRKELDDLEHDQAVLSQILFLVSSLKQNYKHLNADAIQDQLKNVQTSIKIRDEQLQMSDSCTIVLSQQAANRYGQRVKTVFIMSSPEAKQDWVMDFRAVKLAQEKINRSPWISESEMIINAPLVVKGINVDVTSEATQVTCATPIFLTNSNGGIGLQYLWVCSSNQTHGQITLLSLHSSQPQTIESFRACDGHITCSIMVPSNIHSSLDHVWMADDTNHVYVHGLRDGEWREPRRVFPVPAQVNDMCCVGNYVFMALEDGSVLKYAKRKGSALYDEPLSKHLRDAPVNSLLPCENNKIIAACGNALFVLSAVKQLGVIDKNEFGDLSRHIEKMVRVGSGIWFSCSNDTNLRLIHAETYNIIQEIDMGKTLTRLINDGSIDSNKVYITTLSASQGLVWVGTSTGHILTIPVPVLDGIPMRSGKVSLSSLSHTNAVRFILTIQCSLTFATRPISGNSEEFDMASLTDSYNSGNANRLSTISSANTMSEESLDYQPDPFDDQPPLDIKAKRGSFTKIKNKMKDKLGGNLNKNRSTAASTPNLAYRRGSEMGHGLQRSTAGLYESLMRLDNIDETVSTTALLNNLVPTNQAPMEKQFTLSKISTNKAGAMKVKKSSSISNLVPSQLSRPLAGPSNRAGVQSMWNLNSTTSHSISSEFVDRSSSVAVRKSAQLDQAFTDVNVELRETLDCDEPDRAVAGRHHGDHNYVSPLTPAAKLAGSHYRDSRPLSINSVLSQVAEDEEYLEYDDLSPLDEEEEEGMLDSFSQSVDSAEQDDAEDYSYDSTQDACIITNFLKASLIVSGGEGFINHNEQDATNLHEQSTLIMWQQNTT